MWVPTTNSGLSMKIKNGVIDIIPLIRCFSLI